TEFLQPSPPRISNASSLAITSLLITHISHPFSTTGHTRILTIPFLRALFILLVSSSFRLLNASLSHPIRCFIFSIHLPSCAITDPRYLNFFFYLSRTNHEPKLYHLSNFSHNPHLALLSMEFSKRRTYF